MFILDQYQIHLQGAALFAPLTAQLSSRDVLAIQGPSGSGKSTLLADICGVLNPVFFSTGALTLNDRNLRDLSVDQRNVGILFQDDLLFPHLNVYDNLAFGLPSGLSRDVRDQRIHNALEEAGLTGFAPRDIATLSGGQRSRIALLRTLLSEPDLILLDEPFSKLDQQLRTQFRGWVFEHIAEQNIPSILVTHDPADIPEGSQRLTLNKEPANA
ncbi:ATP-binding cassette domain-containing protein [Reinekea blandensis]|uniref:ABC transporter, ATP-binding protein n=1 Tax=Reinekea blandensis MED297 TaxID=314283 RepID=A4BAL1_9GAMM|nr:ATP-binding cassette domain-containing protein [Reinekea blandensis]EAR10967.1 ABC transporter, ATP-binding protein [Reinekea sp. MED297] [Reinekea blandensis MED297]